MAHIRNEELYHQLLEGAIDSFVRKGYAATRLADVAAAADVTRGPLYYYFSNKAELYQAAAVYLIAEIKENYDRILQLDRPVIQVLRDDYEYCLQSRLRTRFFAQPSDDKSIPDISSQWNMFSKWLIQRKYEVLNAAKARGELRPGCNVADAVTSIYVFFHGMNEVSAMAEKVDGFSQSMLENSTEYFLNMMKASYLA